MPDLRDLLDDEAGRARGRDDGLGRVLRRAGHRRRVRRVASGLAALAIAGASFALAYTAFRPGDGVQPASGPTPTPTPTSDQETPGALPIAVLGGSREDDTLVAYATARVETEGTSIRQGGVEVVETGTAADQPARTLILCPPQYDGIATRLQQALFPGARLGGALPDQEVAIRIILGRDFSEQDDGGLEAFQVVEAFMTARVLGSGAEGFLSKEAASAFESGEGGLSLYGYTEGASFAIDSMFRSDDGFRAVVRIEAAATGYETLAIGQQDGVPLIVGAELNEPPGPIGPAFEEVEAFVEGFLEARRDRAGAGTYLGEDARAAYASHEGGLDLLGYATGPAQSRIVSYDKLSPARHRVVVRFHRSEAASVKERLLVGWRGGDVFVILDAERTA
jgi:hypothetical protein